MDELRDVLHDLDSKLHEAIELAHRAGYIARQLGVPDVNQHIENDLLRSLIAFADDDLTAVQPGSVGQLLALLEEDV